MKYLFFSLFVCLQLSTVFGQEIKNFKSYKAAPSSYESIKVIPIHSDKHASSFIIFIKEGVKLHKHVKHTEHVLIIQGKGTMKLGELSREVKKGDLIVIPKGEPHSVEVKGKKPLKVLSIQSPKFMGEDRIMLE